MHQRILPSLYGNLFLIFLILTNIVSGQSSNVKGIIYDSESGLPLEDALFSIEQTNSHSHTSSNGSFSINGLLPGKYSAIISKLGYESQKLAITIVEGESKFCEIKLVYHPVGLSSIEIAADRPVSAASSKHLNSIDFENRPKNSAQDMLRLVPGLFIAQHAGGGKAEQIFIRGFDCDHGTDVATFVDGMPVNMPSHGHGQGYSDLHFLIPETVKGMEIFKGPYSPRFGNFSTAAAVEFNTFDSLERNLFQTEIVYVPNAKNITATRQLVLFEIPNFGTNINSYIAADFANNRSYFEDSQHFKRLNLFSKTTFEVSDHSKIQLTLSGFSSSWDASGQIPERAVKQNLITRFGSIDNTEGGTTQRNNFNVVYHSKIGSTEFETQAFASDYNFKLFSNFTFYLDDPVNADQIEQDDNRTIRGLNVHYTFGHKLFSMNNKFTIGASFRSDEIENQLWHTVKRERLDVRSHAKINEHSTGIFLNEVLRFSDNFRIETGGRFDYFIFDVEDLILTDSSHANYSGYNYQMLVSPKVNMIYTYSDLTQFFLNFGSGFHSNDARSVAQQPNTDQLPRAPGAEVGALFHPTNKLVANIALWYLELENELVYVGDAGTTENNGASRRIGIDLSLRYQFTTWLFADADLNISKSRFLNKSSLGENANSTYIPLAAPFTSTGGLTAKYKNGVETTLRYRFMSDRPANENNSVVAHGYKLIDFSAGYTLKHFKTGLSIENITNVNWNEAQFDTESRLANEVAPVDEIHFTPGTPLSFKLTIGYVF